MARPGFPILAILLAVALLPSALAQTFIVPPGKISGEIIQNRDRKANLASLSAQEQGALMRQGLDVLDLETEACALYVTHPLSPEEIEAYAQQGIHVTETYVPPVPGRHANGFYIANVPYGSLGAVQGDARILRLDSLEHANFPHNDLAAVQTHVAEVHAGTGVAARNGAGVKVAVADSGFDLTHADLPTPVEAYDLTDGNSLATWGTNVANTVSAHGTHVLGSIGGSGLLSAGKYIGSAPGASYYLYKVGNDVNASASDVDIIEAINRAHAVGCQIFSLSYGGINSSMDGSDPVSQAVDAATAAGMTCFISAGNEGAGDSISHTLANVALSSSVGSIAFTVTNPSASQPYTSSQSLYVIWRDNLLSDGNITLSCTNLGGGESLAGGFSSISTRGTEVRTYSLVPNLAAGASKTYLFTLSNSASSGVTPSVHIYRNSGVGKFDNFVAAGTVGSPGLADTAIAIGAWTQRRSWRNYQNTVYQFSSLTVDTLAPFSSRGPRIDGVTKPDVVAPGAAMISARDSVGSLAAAASLIVDNDGLNLNGSGPANYYVMTGTSMACPYAAGIAALVLEANPSLTPTQLREVLFNTASNPGSPNGNTGRGLLNALGAIQLAETDYVFPEAELYVGSTRIESGGGPVAFGQVLHNAESPTVTLTLRNTGLATLLTSGTVSLPAGYSLVEGLATSIPAGGSDDFTLALDTAPSGTFGGVASFLSNDATDSPYTFSLSGEVLQARISVTPLALDFGAWDLDDGATGTQTVLVSNTGTAALALTSVTLTGPGAAQFSFAAAPSLAPLAAGTSRTINLNFDPVAIGATSATLQIASADADQPLVEVALSGLGLDAVIEVTPASLAFGSQPLAAGPTAAQGVVIRNAGNAPLTLDAVSLTGSAAFAITADSGEATLAPDAERTVEIVFDPTAAGPATGQLVVVLSDDAGTPSVSIGLSGTGAAPLLTLSHPELLFAPVDVILGDAPTTQALTLENEGTLPLQITALTLGGDHPADFALENPPTLPLTLAAGAWQELVLRFAPVATERTLDLTATLSITSNTPGTTTTLTLRGDAVPAELSLFTAD